MKQILFFDLEVDKKENIIDIGASSNTDETFHEDNINKFYSFIHKYPYLCGHNIFNHDLKYLDIPKDKILIDTLLWSPLLFPEKPYHPLLKNDKWSKVDSNNPVSDSKKARDLLSTLVTKFDQLDYELKLIFYGLLNNDNRYSGFLHYIDFKVETNDLPFIIRNYYKEYICANADINELINNKPVELAYALSVIKFTSTSILPAWVSFQYPDALNIIHRLKSVRCEKGCDYCNYFLDEHQGLKDFFKYDSFRKPGGKDIQRQAVVDALNLESLLVVFPTGGGKSLTFQLPALMQGRNEGGLTVVISPLQALMKDQIDGLEQDEISSAVAINGLLGPIERKKAFEYLENGTAHILYVSPEMLRSRSIETMLKRRNVVRFVIDEAHCFSTWGQDFRVDYQYIAKFIKKLNEFKKKSIPVSCFTATAKPQVVEDIKEYFKSQLDLEFKEYIYSGSRENLSYHVFLVDDEKDRYQKLRGILETTSEPTIIYASRTKTTKDLADRLNNDGFPATYFHGQLDSDEKVENQDLFMRGEVNIIVATTAFGMGVNKNDVKNVIHYNISSSLENYIQEAGRAGRNPVMSADCYILFNEDDLNTHFNLLNQTRLNYQEINQVWEAIKRLTKNNWPLRITPLELALEAGWKEEENDVANRIMTAVNELERAKYIERLQNDPTLYGTSLRVSSVMEAKPLIEGSEELMKDYELTNTVISKLLTVKHINKNDPMARVDLIAIQLGRHREEIFKIMMWLKEVGVIDEDSDIRSYVGNESERKLLNKVLALQALEKYLIKNISLEMSLIEYKQIVEYFLTEEQNYQININQIIWLINYLVQEEYLKKGKTLRRHAYYFAWTKHREVIKAERAKHYDVAYQVLDYLYKQANLIRTLNQKEVTVTFSLKDIKKHYKDDLFKRDINYGNIENVLQFLTKNKIIRIDSAFFVLYNAIRIKKLIEEPRIRYKEEDCTYLIRHYEHKNKQIHIVGEYAKLMATNKEKGNEFVHDYFNMNFDDFLNKYFKNRIRQLNVSQTANKYNRIFAELSLKQKEIINDQSKYITVFAGPGSGKTRLLVHKLASLALLEKVKVEQILALTFSNAAAVEFKTRLKDLIGDIAYFVEVSTFHSYCFKLLEITGDLRKSETVVKDATEKILNEEVDKSKIGRTILVIDEAQDMSEAEYDFVKALMQANPYMKILAVGDSDQNIYEFRESYSYYFESLRNEEESSVHELVTNYRSKQNLIIFSNMFVKRLKNRVKKRHIEAFQEENGIIEITEYTAADDLVIPIVNDFLSKDLKGSTAILTRDNKQAINIYTQLSKYRDNVKLLQAEVNYRLFDLYEFRTFVSYFEGETISDEAWNIGIHKLKEAFKDSVLLESVLKLLNDFKEVNQQLYLSDLHQFLLEAKEEDFYKSDNNEIVVSTMHQSKGKEFDNVFIYNCYKVLPQEEVRLLYVAMTRAKENLFIHTKTDIFKKYNTQDLSYKYDNNTYEQPNEIVIPLNHAEVQLGVFKHRQKELHKLCSGVPLKVKDYAFGIKGKALGYFSNGFRQVIDRYKDEGYILEKAIVNHLVYWFDKEEEKEYLIALPLVTFSKKDNETIEDDTPIEPEVTFKPEPILEAIVEEETKNKDNEVESKIAPMLTIRRFKGSAKKLSSALRQYRKREAIKDHIKPYAVFSNRTLVELVEKVPLTLEELKKIYGIGPHKLDKYGESLLEIIKRVNEKEKMRIITAPLSKKTVK